MKIQQCRPFFIECITKQLNVRDVIPRHYLKQIIMEGHHIRWVRSELSKSNLKPKYRKRLTAYRRNSYAIDCIADPLIPNPFAKIKYIVEVHPDDVEKIQALADLTQQERERNYYESI